MSRILITSLFGQITGDLRSDRGCGASGLAELITLAGHTPVFYVKKVTPARKKRAEQFGFEFTTNLYDTEIDRVILYATSLNLFGGKFDDFNCTTIDWIASSKKPIEYFIEDGRKSCSWSGPIEGMRRLLDEKCYDQSSTYGAPLERSIDYFMNMDHPPVIFPRPVDDYKRWASIYPWHDPEVECRWMPNYETRIDLWASHFELFNDGYKYECAPCHLSYVGAWRDGERYQRILDFADGCQMRVGGKVMGSYAHSNIDAHGRRVSDKELGNFLREGQGQLILGNEYLRHMMPVHRLQQALVCGNVPFVDKRFDPDGKNFINGELSELLVVNDGREVLKALESMDPDTMRTLLKEEWEEQYNLAVDHFLNSKHSDF